MSDDGRKPCCACCAKKGTRCATASHVERDAEPRQAGVGAHVVALSDPSAQAQANASGHAVQAASGTWFMPETVITAAPAPSNTWMWVVGIGAVVAGAALALNLQRRGV
jgi:hypothetical protein